MINKADRVIQYHNAKDADNIPKNRSTSIDSMLHKIYPNIVNIQIGDVAKMEKIC